MHKIFPEGNLRSTDFLKIFSIFEYFVEKLKK